MSLPVTIENQALRLEVYPHFGGKVHSIVDKADEYELLFDFPAEFPTTCQYDQPYPSSYYAGWDECFPTIAPGKYPGHPYDGIPVPDHAATRASQAEHGDGHRASAAACRTAAAATGGTRRARRRTRRGRGATRAGAATG